MNVRVKRQDIMGDGTDVRMFFKCPGCGWSHAFRIVGSERWDYNNDPVNPTFSPSLLYQGANRCHSYVRNGKIEFLNDCSHSLKGKTVELELVDDVNSASSVEIDLKKLKEE